MGATVERCVLNGTEISSTIFFLFSFFFAIQIFRRSDSRSFELTSTLDTSDIRSTMWNTKFVKSRNELPLSDVSQLFIDAYRESKKRRSG